MEKEYTFVTNLEPTLYPIQTIKALYHQRWDIEEFYKVLKTRLGGDFYNYKTVEAMYRKLYFQALVAIITGFVMKKSEEEWLANPPINPPKNKKWKQKSISQV